MPRHTPIGILVLWSIIVSMLMTWQVAPTLAGFTPTPRPPTPQPNTPLPPTLPPTTPPTAPPTSAPPEKPPKDTPIPTATLNLTATPASLPFAGGQVNNEMNVGVVLLAVVIGFICTAAGVVVHRMVKTQIP